MSGFTPPESPKGESPKPLSQAPSAPASPQAADEKIDALIREVRALRVQVNQVQRQNDYLHQRLVHTQTDVQTLFSELRDVGDAYEALQERHLQVVNILHQSAAQQAQIINDEVKRETLPFFERFRRRPEPIQPNRFPLTGGMQPSAPDSASQASSDTTTPLSDAGYNPVRASILANQLEKDVHGKRREDLPPLPPTNGPR